MTIRSVYGNYRSYGFYINPWFTESMGSFKNIFIENVDLQALPNTYTYHDPFLFSIGGNIECLTLKNIRSHNSCDNRTLIELGLPFHSATQETYGTYELPMEQHLENVINDEEKIKNRF